MAKKGGANFSVTVDTRGMQRVIRETPQLASDFLDAEAEQMVNGIKLSFGSGPGGRTYKRGSVVHIASQPGYPPNVDIGSLINSITWRHLKQLVRRIEDGVEHGIMMELGTKHTAPRPFMGPEFERTRRRFGQDAIDFGIVP